MNGEKLIKYGCIDTSDKINKSERLGLISDCLEKIIKDYKIKSLALESLFFAKNVKSAMKVSEAIGVIKVLGYRCGIEVFEYTPLQIKSTLVGYGRAEKSQVEMMVRNALNLKKNIKPSHAADAVAVALTHLYVSHV
jgi:crossover junction endodeoxyribonuclease RuvC